MNINTPKIHFHSIPNILHNSHATSPYRKRRKQNYFPHQKNQTADTRRGQATRPRGPGGGLALILFLTYEFWYMYHLLMRHEAPAPSCKFRMQRSRKMQVDLSLSRTRGSDAIYRRNIKCSVYRVCHKNYYNMLGGVCVVLFLHVRYARTVRVHFAKSEYCDD